MFLICIFMCTLLISIERFGNQDFGGLKCYRVKYVETFSCWNFLFTKRLMLFTFRLLPFVAFNRNVLIVYIKCAAVLLSFIVCRFSPIYAKHWRLPVRICNRKHHVLCLCCNFCRWLTIFDVFAGFCGVFERLWGNWILKSGWQN